MAAVLHGDERRSDDRPAFSVAQCEALFAAVLIDDEIDADTKLPDAIALDYDRAQLADCYMICRDVWTSGVDRARFDAMIATLHARRTLDAEDKLRFKHARARFKQLRFAFANFDTRHRYPMALNLITTLMGHLQDAFKNGRDGAVGRLSLLLRAFLSPLPYRYIQRELDRFRVCTPEDFRRYVGTQIDFIRTGLAKPDLTAEEFHEIRKIISRQASFYVSLDTLYPSPDHRIIFRYLSAINGMMGRMHDDLIERSLRKEQDYRGDRFVLPEAIRQRLQAVTERYPQN